MIEEREVHGNETGNNIGKEILAADQPHAQVHYTVFLFISISL